jgi:DNA end-binding protein Ku
LIVHKYEIPVKVYAAVVDRQIHFHLLHKRDRARVQQRMVEAGTENPVPLDQARKAFEAEPGLYVILTSEELEESSPEPARVITVNRFVPARSIDVHWFDRPYYLGPEAEAATDYFALALVLESKRSADIASWVMRKHSYVGALISQGGYLILNTLRHAEEVIPSAALLPPTGSAPEARERSLAEQLIAALSGPFRPETYHDEYQERIRELIDAKRAGKRPKVKRAHPRGTRGSLADVLRSSLRNVTTRSPASERQGAHGTLSAGKTIEAW